MVDIQFTINKKDLQQFKKYCSNNNINIINCNNRESLIICSLNCELFEYVKLKKQTWNIN